MRVVFYDCGCPSLGIQYLLRVCQDKGHETFLFFDNSFSRDYLAQDFPLQGFLSLRTEDVCKGIMAFCPDVVCFSMFSNGYKESIETIRHLKKAYPEVIVICGGVHATLVPQVVLENEDVDFVVLGEAENSLPLLLDALSAAPISDVKTAAGEKLPGAWNVIDGQVIDRGLSPIVRELDRVPFPEKRMHVAVNPSLGRIYTMMASRGCFYQCTFCNIASIGKIYQGYKEQLYRLRSVDNVMAELHEVAREFNPRHIEFYDDCFGAKPSWLKEFCRRYKDEIGIPFGVQTHPLLHNAESLDLMADSGLEAVEFGIQTANAAVRKEMLRRDESNEEVRDLVRHARKHGMFVELDMIMNLPGETMDHVNEVIRFVQDARPSWVNLSFLQYFPRAEITDLARQKGILTDHDLTQINRGERIGSYRLLSKSRLTTAYRVLPYQIFFAFRFPKKISDPLIRWVNLPVVQTLCSFFASYFVYASRSILSFLNKRDIFLRRQIVRALYAALWVLKRKLFGVGAT